MQIAMYSMFFCMYLTMYLTIIINITIKSKRGFFEINLETILKDRDLNNKNYIKK